MIGGALAGGEEGARCGLDGLQQREGVDTHENDAQRQRCQNGHYQLGGGAPRDGGSPSTASSSSSASSMAHAGAGSMYICRTTVR